MASAQNEIVLVRHGESEGNVARELAEQQRSEVIGVTQRDADVPLTSLGRRQAETLIEPLQQRSFDRVWTSPYARAAETAAIACPQAQLLMDERLRDRELGVLDRLTRRGVAARFPDEAERRRWVGKFYHRPPGGESWADVLIRLRSWWADQPDDPGRMVVFTHDAVIYLIRYVLERMDEATVMRVAAESTLANASITRLVRCGGPEHPWTLATFGEQDHLGELVTEHRAEKPHG
jgi:broad specificity phosphatase PhoE